MLSLEERKARHCEAQRRYRQTAKGKETERRYQRGASRKATLKRYLGTPGGRMIRYLINRQPDRMLHKRLYMQERRAA